MSNDKTTTPTQEHIDALIAAMDQVLDDMGIEGRSVCGHTKAMARIAFEPFLDPECRDWIMSLELAEQLVRDIEDGR